LIARVAGPALQLASTATNHPEAVAATIILHHGTVVTLVRPAIALTETTAHANVA